ncbi:MAG: zinc ABC transporter permease subunit ZnuB [Halothiobacillaceae bacterium]
MTDWIGTLPWWDDFLWRALLGGLGVVLIAGPLGCFVVWRRMAYFGATLAHAGLLGVGLGFLLSIAPMLSVALVSVATALLLLLLEKRGDLASDTILGILAHGTLAIGLIVVSFLESARVDLFGYLFGDILALSNADLLVVLATDIVVLALLFRLWPTLLSITLSEDMARAEGLPVERSLLLFTLLLAVTIAVAMKLVGVLLITSLLIIPAAAARRLASSPEQMAAGAVGVGMLSVAGGLGLSWYHDTPTGPSIVVAALALFLLSLALPRRS